MDVTSVDLKKTVSLPKTTFPMKAALPTLEPKLLETWEASDLYGQIRKARAGRPQYVLHDGPPYANGNIHLGTAFNKILKDFIVKSKTMAGFDAPYIPGWDCHGLPIEFKVDAELGKRKASMTTAQIRAECRAYASKFVDIHRREFKRLGILGRWNDPYLTMSPEYESVIAQAFVDFLHSGRVYKGLKPVHWCIKDRTALAEAEVEYENHASPTIYVRFKLRSDPAAIDPALAGKEVAALIWTTTPWTIPANLAISFNPKFDYVAVDTPQGVTDRRRGFAREGRGRTWLGSNSGCAVPWSEAGSGGLSPSVSGSRFAWLDRRSRHARSGYGRRPYRAGTWPGRLCYWATLWVAGLLSGGCEWPHCFRRKASAGRLPEELLGKTIWDANPIVIRLLEEHGALAGQARLDHSYPHCWRCHNPVIFRATEQWFIGMDRENLRSDALAAIKQVAWHPDWGEERMTNMIAMRPDWCISRQRVWGVPIIVFYCDSCGEPFTDRAVLESVVAQIPAAYG